MAGANGDLAAKLDDLMGMVGQGQLLEGIEKYYADDVVMTEPLYGETAGKAANVKREQQFLDNLAEFKRFDVLSRGVGDGVTFYECVMDWTTKDGQDVHVEQVSVAKWRDGKIYHERFYYNAP
jgi:ketosteroid isomerase-like protein